MEWFKYKWVISTGSKEKRRKEVYVRGLLNFKSFFTDIIDVLFDNKRIDLRNILKWEKLRIEFSEYYNIGNVDLRWNEHPIIFYIILLAKIKGGAENLKQSISNIQGRNVIHRDIYEHIKEMIFINTIPIHSLNDTNIPYHYIDDISVRLIIKDKIPTIEHTTGQGLFFYDKHLIWALNETIDFLMSKDILK